MRKIACFVDPLIMNGVFRCGKLYAGTSSIAENGNNRSIIDYALFYKCCFKEVINFDEISESERFANYCFYITNFENNMFSI